MSSPCRGRPRTLAAAKPALIVAQAAALVVIGLGIGLWDANRRPVDLNRQTAPPPVQPGGAQDQPAAPQQDQVQAPAAPVVEPTPAVTPPKDAAAPAPATAPAAAAFRASTKADLAGKHGHITLEEALDFHQFMGAIFLDARTQDEFAAGHVPGAYFASLSVFRAGRAPEILYTLDKMHPIVVYCGGGDDCSASEDVARLLNGDGFFNVHILHDGYVGWAAVGYPVSVGGGQ